MAKGRVRRLYKTNRVGDFDHETDRTVRAQQIYQTIDRQGFQWVVVFVAGIGFFLDGYTLFASNIALPMLAYVYWPDEENSKKVTFINICTLAGTMFGQVLFGILGDKNGRRKMYGIELLLLISSTLGVVMCSEGYNGSMNVFAWLSFWRVMVGIGVGADYPLSAVITAEFAPTKQRARMMASVFSMQPLGQITGNIVSIIVIAASSGRDDVRKTIDIAWRWVIGLGAVPGVLALAFRFAIPETPRFLLDIEDDPIKAEFDATPLFGESTELEEGSWGSAHGSTTSATSGYDEIILPAPAVPDGQERTVYGLPPLITLNSSWKLSKADIKQYFWTEGNWRTLFATSMTWLLLDFGFYGIGLSNPQFLAKTWGSLNLSAHAPTYVTDDSGNVSQYKQFFDNSVHALVILNSGSALGMILMIIFSNRVNRVKLQFYGFLILAAIFVALGVVFITAHLAGGPVIIALYILGQTAFNFGPNATTYIISGEAFPTRYRASCHGIAAGAGKLGSILVQLFSAYYRFGSTSTSRESTRRYGIIIIVFAAVMLVGAAITYFWMPDMQHPRKKGSGWTAVGESKTLEELALGRKGVQSESVRRSRRSRN